MGHFRPFSTAHFQPFLLVHFYPSYRGHFHRVFQFVNDLVIRKLSSLGGLVLLDDTQAKFGALRIKTADGSVSVLDASGVERVNIKSGNIDSLATLKSGDSSVGPIHNDQRLFGSTGAYSMSNKITITQGGSTLKIATTIGAFASTRNPDPSVLPYAYITLYLTKNGSNIATLGNAKYDMANGVINDFVVVNWSGVVDAGTYGLQAMVTLSNYDRTTASASIEVSTMSAGYVDRVMRTQIGANGLFSYWNANKYLYAAENGNGEVFLEVKGKTDMPGVLAVAQITTRGTVYKPWGAVSISSAGAVSGEAYNWRVYHNYNKDTYIAMVTPFGGGAVARVIREDAGVVCVYADGPFNITLHGDNA